MPLYSRAITVSYYNYYLKKPCVLDLTYTLQKGFESLDEAKEIISKKWNPEHFTYILVDQQIYAVAMELIRSARLSETRLSSPKKFVFIDTIESIIIVISKIIR